MELEFSTTFISKFKEAFICTNGQIDLVNISLIIEFWNIYGDILCKQEFIGKPFFPSFSKNNLNNQAMAELLYLFFIKYYNIINEYDRIRQLFKSNPI